MNAADIQAHIEELVAEEHRLFDRAAESPLDATEKARLADVNVQLDRYYDLLRQRRARAEFAQDPDAAHIRAADTVEKYLQ
jgi:transcriptional accessory protein Tex/SPT6